jgi:hypothetical protein
MMRDDQLHTGTVCRHHTGKVYTILHVYEDYGTQKPCEEVKTIVEYMGANGRLWTRPLPEFREKFDVLFDGTNLAIGRAS